MKKIFLPFRYGMIMSLFLIGYFLLLSLVKLHIHPLFSLFNGAIVGLGIFYAIRQRKKNMGSSFNYVSGIMAGIYAGFVSTILFSIFMLVYVTELNTTFINSLLTEWDDHIHIGVGTFVLVVALMGFSTVVVLSLTIMQYFKKPLLSSDRLIYK